MKNLTLENVTDAVLHSIEGTEDARLKELLTIFIRKAHEAVRESGLTHAEWLQLTEFLRREGDISSDQRNEFILLSDVLGISSLVDLMNAVQAPDATVSSLLGPFYTPDAPFCRSAAISSATMTGTGSCFRAGCCRPPGI